MSYSVLPCANTLWRVQRQTSSVVTAWVRVVTQRINERDNSTEVLLLLATARAKSVKRCRVSNWICGPTTFDLATLVQTLQTLQTTTNSVIVQLQHGNALRFSLLLLQILCIYVDSDLKACIHTHVESQPNWITTYHLWNSNWEMPGWNFCTITSNTFSTSLLDCLAYGQHTFSPT